MNDHHPAGEAMSRASTGTAATSEPGNSQPLDWKDASDQLNRTQWFWLAHNIYAIRPTKAFALPIDGETTKPTRWRF